jgi:hypothetical protein
MLTSDPNSKARRDLIEVRVHAAEQDWDDVTAAHDAFRKEQPTLDLKRLIFIDETAACLA